MVDRAVNWNRYTWGGDFGCHPTESEAIAHLIVPLLLAVGWEPEQIAIGWRYTDIALFASVQRSPENCLALVEVKRLGDGLDYAHTQASAYASRLPNPIDVVVTDGMRCELYPSEQAAGTPLYANLGCLRGPSIALLDRLSARAG